MGDNYVLTMSLLQVELQIESYTYLALNHLVSST